MGLHDLMVTKDDLDALRPGKPVRSADGMPVDPTDIVEWWVARATRSRALDEARAEALAAARA